ETFRATHGVPAFDRHGIAAAPSREIEHHPFAAAQLGDFGEHRLVRMVEEPGAQEIGGATLVEARAETRQSGELLDLRRKGETVAVAAEIEGFHTEAVARSEQNPAPRIVEHEGEHAVESVGAGDAPGGVGREQDLGVAGGAEGETKLLKLVAQLAVV